MTRITPDDLVRDLHIVAEDLETLVLATAHDAGEKVVAARERAQQLIKIVKTRVSDVEHRLADQARTAAKDADAFVRAHAWETIEAAAKAGIVLGIMLNERKQKR